MAKIEGLAGLKITTVAMASVPAGVSVAGRVSPYVPLFQQILARPQSEAVRVEFPDVKRALYVRAVLRKMAQKQGRRLSSNQENGGAVRYFWLEPKEK